MTEEELVTAVCCKEEGDLRHPSKDQEDRRLLDRVPPRLEFWAISTQAQQRKKPSNKSIIHSLASSRLPTPLSGLQAFYNYIISESAILTTFLARP